MGGCGTFGTGMLILGGLALLAFVILCFFPLMEGMTFDMMSDDYQFQDQIEVTQYDADGTETNVIFQEGKDFLEVTQDADVETPADEIPQNWVGENAETGPEVTTINDASIKADGAQFNLEMDATQDIPGPDGEVVYELAPENLNEEICYIEQDGTVKLNTQVDGTTQTTVELNFEGDLDAEYEQYWKVDAETGKLIETEIDTSADLKNIIKVEHHDAGEREAAAKAVREMWTNQLLVGTGIGAVGSGIVGGIAISNKRRRLSTMEYLLVEIEHHMHMQ